MSCSIIRKDGEIERVLAPNGKDSKLYNSILEIEPDKEAALRIWAQAYTPKFKTWFGDWELLSKAEALLNNIKISFYRDLIKDNLERGLFELAIQYNSSNMDKDGMKAVAGEKLAEIAHSLFPDVKLGDVFIPTISDVTDENYEPLLVHHYSNSEFEVFDINRAGEATGEDSEGYGLGFYFSTEKEIFSSLGKYHSSYFLNIKNPLKGVEATKAIDNTDISSKDFFDGLISDVGVVVAFNPNQIKSTTNRGSYLTSNNSTTLDIKTKDSELFNVEIFDGGVSVGGIVAINDGSYLTIEGIAIDKTGENIGTYANLQMAQFAIDNGLQLRSDLISTRMSDAYIALWQRFVDAGQAERQDDRYVFTGDPKKVLDNVFYSLSEDENKVDYKLKAVEILLSEKASEWFRKADKNQWRGDLFWNKLSLELQIPSEQVNLLKQLSVNNPYNREELLTSLISSFSYTIEINVAKDSRMQFEEDPYSFTTDDNKNYTREVSYQTGNQIYKVDDKIISHSEFIKALNNYREGKNSQHYSNMTVPGGTNYTENEITTPQIIPSISGHAQFATDKGIGWFRSDEKVRAMSSQKNSQTSGSRDSVVLENDRWLVKNTEIGVIESFDTKEEALAFMSFDTNEQIKINDTKIRRILEVQSDLFQKGRDVKKLNKQQTPKYDKGDIIVNDKGEFEFLGYFVNPNNAQEYVRLKNTKTGEEGVVYQDKFDKRVTPNNDLKANDFLQLLNKDNNWVTFFVKSIIQDSAKKGYEKVLFPSGDTAAKIEGHQTSENFIKIKEKRKEQVKNRINILRGKYEVKEEEDVLGQLFYRIYDESGKPESGSFLIKEKAEEFIEDAANNLEVELQQVIKEIEDAKTGKLKISAIANFYESTITNILKKQGFNPSRVTDEYGNTWNEISITPEIAQKVETVLFNLKLQGKYEMLAEAALNTLTKNGFVTKFNPNNALINEDRWYFVKSTGLENNQKLYHQYMSMNNLNRGMFIEDISQDGVPYLKPNRDFNLKDSIEENNERIHKDKYEALIDFFVNKLNIPKDKINYITKKEFAEKFPEVYRENSQSTYHNGQFYFFTNNQTADITVEELLHPFIYTVKKLNPQLFANLLREAQKNYPALHQKIQILYKSQPQSIRDQELVTQSLSRVFNNVYENEEPKSFFDVIKDFVKWMAIHLNGLLNYFGTGKTIHLDVTDLHPLTSMEQIAQILNASDTKFDIIFPEGTFFNMSENPEDFNKMVTTLLTDKRVEAKVEEVLAKLPSSIRDIKKRLDSRINDKERDELRNVLSQMEEFEHQDKQDLIKAQLRGIITTVQIFNSLKEELDRVDESDMDSNLKLSYYMSIFKTAESLSGFKDIMLDLSNELESQMRRPNNNNIQTFYLLINSAIAAEDKIKSKIQDLIKAPLLEELVQSNEHTYSIPLANLDKQIRDIERDISNTSSQPAKEKLYNKIKIINQEKAKILEKAPTRENLKKVFDGVFKDANVLSHIFESGIANGHPLVNTLQNMVNVIYDRAGISMLNSKNEAQSQSDEFSRATGRGMRDMNKRFEGIGDDLIKIPTGIKFKPNSDTELDLDKDGNIQFNYVQQNALVQAIDNSYFTQYMELELKKDYYLKLFRQDTHNNIKDSQYEQKYRDAYKAFDDFKKENSQRKYTDEYYEFRAMLDQEVGGKTIRKIIGDAYDEIERLKDNALRSDSYNREKNNDLLRQAEIELKKLKSEYNDDGTKKDENGLKIASILKEYSKLRYEFGSDVLTEDGETKYRFDLKTLEDKKDQYQVGSDMDTYHKQLAKIQQIVISPDYFDAIVSITDNINDITNALVEAATTGEVSKFIDSNTFKDKKRNVYQEIRDMVKPYRDENQVIDGISLSKQNPDLVKRVKDAQQYVENLKFETRKLWSLSPSESDELKKLSKNKDRTNEESIRFEQLTDKKNAFKQFKMQNISMINDLTSLFKELGEISSTVSTEYYDKVVEDQIAKLKENPEIKQAAINHVEKHSIIDLDGIIFIKEDGKWYQEQKLGKKVTKMPLSSRSTNDISGSFTMINYVVAQIAQESLKLTDWWRENHYTQYIYDKKTGLYKPVERAIYIWENQIPNNPNFIEKKPQKIYYRYQVNDKYINKDFSTTYRNIPTVKKGKFINPKYADTMKDTAKAKFLQYLTNKYLDIQKIYPDSQRMGHVLPAVIKTDGENSVNATNKILSFDGTFKEMFHTNIGKTDTDTSYLIGGSQSNTRSIPMRFTGKMDTSHQTKDALASILLFEYHASLYRSLNEQLPVFEAAQLLAAEVDTLEKKNYIEKLGFKDKVRRVFSMSKKETEEEQTQRKDVEKSVLSKSVDNLVDVFIYGQRIKPMIIDLPFTGKVDLAKVSSTVLGWAAKSIFIGNIITSINNSISTRLQAVVNSGVKSKLYSLKNLTNGQALSIKYGKDLLRDWTKLGNKSLVGQVLDHFAFLAENPGREITNKSEFTILKNKTEFLTSPKQISEFEVLFVQFMTMADATVVKVNGKETRLSKIEDIFELGKDGNLKYKDGVEFTKQQEDTFRGKFQSMARKLQGAYRQTEISSIETNWAGKSALFLRRYFTAMAVNRFSGERWNAQEQEIQIGYQRETFINLIKMFKDYQNLGLKQWSKMSDKEKVSFYKTSMEYGILILMIGLLSLAGGDDDKKKLKENSWAHNMTLVALLRAKSEMEQFTIKGTDDLIRIGKNPFMIFTTLGNVWKIVGLAEPTVMGNESAFYKQNTGLHDKGDSKLVTTFLKLIGYTGGTLHPEEYYVTFKNMQNRY